MVVAAIAPDAPAEPIRSSPSLPPCHRTGKRPFCRTTPVQQSFIISVRYVLHLVTFVHIMLFIIGGWSGRSLLCHCSGRGTNTVQYGWLPRCAQTSFSWTRAPPPLASMCLIFT